MKQVIGTSSAPKVIGTYSQAIKSGNTVFLSGQIPLSPDTMEIVKGNFKVRVKQVINNLSAVAQAAGGHLHDVVKLTIYLTDMECYAEVNEVMAEYFKEPYPARVLVGVAALPMGVDIEMDAILVLGE